MESNSQQAIIIGVNLFIFITLLTVALTLFTTTQKLATKAGEIISDSTASFVAVIKEDLVEGYVYTYEDLLSIYAKNVDNESKLNQYKVQFEEVMSLNYYINKVGKSNSEYSPENQINQTFSLTVTKNGENIIYTFNANP